MKETISPRNCLVACSPKREMMGARSVAKLFVNSSHQPSSLELEKAACAGKDSIETISVEYHHILAAGGDQPCEDDGSIPHKSLQGQHAFTHVPENS